MAFIAGQPCERCGRPLDANKDCPCTPPKPPPEKRLELKEIKELELKFAEDLEAVFEGRHLEFGFHLRGMLLELWTRARGTRSDTVKELEELRQLKKQRRELEDMIQQAIKAQLPAVAQQFKASFEDVLATEFRTHLVAELENYEFDVDAAVATALARVLELSGSLEGEPVSDHFRLKASGSSSISALPDIDPNSNEPDKTQEVLVRRLEVAGLLPPVEFYQSREWKPVFLNTVSGERAAFTYDDYQQRWPLAPYREVRVPLAWDGASWRFPNPRPVGIANDANSLSNVVTIIVEGAEHSPSEHLGWNWEWDGNQVTGVSGIPGASTGNELVEARYFILPESYWA